ncbi:E3 ubiquitin-protein ligase Siah2 [Frankliniella fusca]|uniref:RING-type E3 ubiquitin transferase n=1 Tax=Frankliniella fusca TaxID=407009 RepID=A0AAE1H7T8_9NEOP|nr:E3 ubiquitin-protein ligase Siah2 [Frankliniella fusca]
MSRSWVEALYDADLDSALLLPPHSPLLDLIETLPRAARARDGGGMDDDPCSITAGLPLLLPDLSRAPSSASSLGQTEAGAGAGAGGSPAPSSGPPMPPFRRAYSRPLLLNQDPAPSPSSGHGFLPDVMPVELRHGLGRRPDLHAELCADMSLLSDTLSRRASRERLLRRQLIGQRIDRNRSLQEVASLDDSRGGPSMSLSATRLPEIHTLHDSSSARSLLARKLSSESQDAKVAKDDGGEEADEDVQVQTYRYVPLSTYHPIDVLLDASYRFGRLAWVAASNKVELVLRTTGPFLLGFQDVRGKLIIHILSGHGAQEALMSLLECPVCRDFLQPPLKQCSNGHVVCFACWPRLSLCPACRAPFIPTASLTLDGILRTLRFPCPNKEHGCSLSLRMDARPAHDQVCPFRPRGCPMARCEWQGLADALAAHCREAHAPIQVERHVVVCVPFQVDRAASTMDGVPTIVHHEQRLFSLSGARAGEGHIFLFQSRYDLWRSKFFAEMTRVAGEPNDNKFSWEVELRSPEVRLCLRAPVAAATSAGSGCAASTAPGGGAVLGTPHGLSPLYSTDLRTPGGVQSPGHLSASAAPPTGLKLDLDVFNQFMEAGKYSLRIVLH